MDALLADDLCLMHLLHRVYFLVFLGLDTPHLTESTLADHILAIEVLAIDLLALQVDARRRLILGLQFGEVDLEAILNILVRFLADGGIASIMFLVPLGMDLFALPCVLVEMRATGHDNSVAAAQTLLTI